MLIMSAGTGSKPLTIHGRVQTARKLTHILTLEKHVEIPVKFQVDPNRPDNVIEFLRGLTDPRYVRQDEQKEYDLDPLKGGWDIYLVNSRTV